MADQSPRSRWVEARGVRTHYVEVGDNGPVAVGFHGAWPGASGQTEMGRLMSRIPPHIRMVAFDSIGGFGFTTPGAPARQGLLSRPNHTHDVVDALCLERFTVVGKAEGAFAAARYAMNHPNRVEKIVLIASHTVATSMKVTETASPELAALAGYDGTEAAMRRILAPLIFDAALLTDELVARHRASADRPGAKAALARYMKIMVEARSDPVAILRMNMERLLRVLADVIPTIFIWGENDVVTPPEIGRRMAALLPNVTFHFVPDAGHQVQIDQPAAVARIIADFIGAPGVAA